MKQGSIPRKEEECPILDDWPAQRSAKIVKADLARFDELTVGIDRSEGVTRIGSIIAEILVNITTELIRTGLQHHAEHATAGAPVLRGERVVHHAEIRDSIWRRA